MKYTSILGATLVLALLLTACGSAAGSPPTNSPQANETPPADIPVTGEVTVNVSESTDFGSILVNAEGMSLYVFLKDTQNSGISTCNDSDGCATEWPPLGTQGTPAAGEGVDANLLRTITRDDGTMQVTYNGWPLYLFEEDSAPGDTNGQGIDEFGGLWFLISPSGDVIQP